MTDCQAVDLTELAQVPTLGRLSDELLGTSTLFERYCIRVRFSHSEHTINVKSVEQRGNRGCEWCLFTLLYFTLQLNS